MCQVKVDHYNHNPELTRVTRAKAEALKSVRQSQPAAAPSPGPRTKAARAASCLQEVAPSLPTASSLDTFARVKDGLFQHLCSHPGPKRMFSVSAVSQVRY